MAVADATTNGLDAWLGASLSSALLDDKDELRDVARRGLLELAEFLKAQKVQ
jgi:hypothetical protein